MVIEPQFIIRYIKDELTPEEKELLDRWLEESDANKEEFGSLVLLWDKIGSSKKPANPNPDKQWNYISNKISSKRAAGTENSKNEFDIYSLPVKERPAVKSAGYEKAINWRWIYKAAAILIISFGIYLFYSRYLTYNSSSQIVAVKDQVPKNSELVTKKGEKITLLLSDGTTVYLNSDSKLSYPYTFRGKERIVELTGEAYFSVKHDTSKPFKVISGSTITTVTGTQFNIRNRNNKVSIVVAKGSVRAADIKSEKVVNLTKGEMASFNSAGSYIKNANVNLNNYLAWRSNKLFFSKTPLDEAMNEIERYYDVNVEIESDSARKKTISGIFETESLDNVLSIISLTLDVKIIHTGRKVIVK